MQIPSQQTTLRNISEFLIITFGSILAGAAVFFFLMPSHLAIGSISGLAIVLSGLFSIPVSALTMVMNIGLLLLGFLLIGREFGVKTVYTSILLPASLAVFERIFPNFTSMTQDPFIDMIGFCLVLSVAQAILFLHNASSGGLDIVAKILNKYLRIDMGKAAATAGLVVALSAALIYDKKTVVISVIGTWIGGVVLDYFLFGMNAKKKVCILSEKHEAIRQFILNDLHSGATMYRSIGAYNLEERLEILTIVDKSEFTRLMKFISQTDPAAFVTVYSVSEVIYRPKP